MSEGQKWLQCPICKETISWVLHDDSLTDIERFPVPIVIRHKDHLIVCYIDSHLQIADTEIVVEYVEAISSRQ
ncbi:MAG: hypothetical protein QXS20_06140 [Candidatus Thorarchaeota archaeon]